MTIEFTKFLWWSSATLRISHPELDPGEMSRALNATASIALHPGESKVPHGECPSAGYWCTQYRVDEPIRPDRVILWAEEFVKERHAYFKELRSQDYHVNVYVGVHSNVLALGFDVPATPTLWELGITVGIEYFCS